MARFDPFRFIISRKPAQAHDGESSPAKLAGILATSVFAIEFGLMALLPRAHLGPWTSALADAALLTTLLAPVLYAFLFRPLHASLAASRAAQRELQCQRDRLEETVKQRTNELVAANAALQDSLAVVDDLYRNAPFGYHSLDGDGVVTRMNDTELSWLGYTREEVIGKKKAADLITRKSAAAFPAQFAQLKETGWLKDLEAEFVRKDGSSFPALVNATAVRDEQGRFMMSRASVYDITLRKQAEREREQYFRFFNASSDLMAIVHTDGVFARINRAFVRTLGYPEPEVLGRTYADFLHPDDLTRTQEALAGVLRGSDVLNFENRCRCKDGTVRWLSWSGQLDAEEGQIYATARDITEQKRFEESQFNSSQLLERVFNTTHFCAAYLDRDFNFIRVNQAYADACARPAGDFPGRNHFDLYPHAENETIFRRAVESGRTITATAKPFRFPDHPEWGTSYWDWTLHPVKSPDGQVEALLFVLLDVTQRQTAETALTEFAEQLETQVAERTAELRAKEQQLQETLSLNQNILKSAAIGIGAYRHDGRCILVNPALAQMVGGTEEQFLSLNFHTLRSWQDSGLLAAATQVLATGVPAERETRLTTTFGRDLWLHCHLSRFESRGEPHLLLMFRDIREQRLTARALTESEQRFKTLAAATFEGIVIAIDGRLVDVNEQLLRMLGYERHELIGEPVLKLIAPEGRAEVAAIHRAGVEAHIEHEILRKDGSRVVVEAHGHSIEQNGVRLRMTAIRDVTARVRAAAELQAATAEAERANNAKSRFLAAASHDLRQPLTALKLYAAALKLKLSAEDQAPVEKMAECVASLSDLLSKLLDLSKLEAGVVTPQPCDFVLDEMLDKVLAACGPQADAKDLNLRFGRFGQTLRTDPVLFQRIVNNLVHNAIRYTERGGVLVAPRRRGGKQWIEVWDTGVGIPPQKTHEIFEEFKQIAPEPSAAGSGLGLAIAARTARLLGLALRVQSRPGRGSMFALELPLGDSERVAPQPEPEIPRRKLRVAVVDDDAAVLDAMVHAMVSAGHTVTGAASGKQLLARPNLTRPDIVVCDYRLAGGETGYEVITAARAAFGAGLPAIIITGDTDPKLIRRMAERDILILHKPVEFEDLQARLDEAVMAGSPG